MHNSKGKKIIWLFGLIMIGALFALSAHSFVQASVKIPILYTGSAEACYAMDVVIIIDQSGSMTGGVDISGEAYQANDPNKRREEAAEHAMDWLASNVLGSCKTAIHRVGVVGFGQTTHTYMELTEIQPSDYEDWNVDFNEYQDKVVPEDLQATDHKLGFAKTKELFDKVNPIGDLPRKKVVIMITDGQPYVYSRGSSEEAQEVYMSELVDQVADDFPFSEAVAQRDQAFRDAIASSDDYESISDLPALERNNILESNPVTNEEYENSYYVFIMAMNAAEPYLDDVGEYFREITQTHGGNDIYNLTNNENSVLEAIDDILSWVSGQSSIVGECGPVGINPYLSGGSLDFYKMNSSIDIAISLEGENQIKNGGSEYEDGSGDGSFWGVVGYSSYGATEHYLFEQPPAGMWYFETDTCSNIKSSFKLFEAVIDLGTSDYVFPYFNFAGTSTSDPENPYKMSFYIEDKNYEGLVLENDPEYPLSMVAEITSPSGKPYTIEFDYQSTDKTWLSEPVPVNELGTFDYKVVGTADCVGYPSDECPEDTFTLFEYEDSYDVANVSPIHFEVIEPDLDGDTQYYVHGKPLKLELVPFVVEVQVMDENSNSFGFDEWLHTSKSSEDIFEAVLTFPDGSTEKMKMEPAMGDKSRFQAVFEFDEEDERIQEGNYAVTVSMQDTWKHEKYFAPETSASLMIERRDPLFHKPLVWLVIKSLTAVIMAFIVGLLIYTYTNTVKGSLEFSNMTHGSKTLALSPRKRILTIRKHGVLRDLKLSSINVRNASVARGKQRLTVVLKPAHGADKRMTLTDVEGSVGGASGSFLDSENNSWRVTYHGPGRSMGRKGGRPSRSPKNRRTPTRGARRR